MYKKSFLISGPAGKIEASWQQKEEGENFSVVGIICHPHPLYEGNMNNKVVTTTVKAFNNMGLPTISFNFRGVGKSEGKFDNTIGETEDCLAVVNWLHDNYGNVELWMAGFSFGSYVAANVASKIDVSQLISIAPPVHHNDFKSLKVNCPWLIIQGDKDEVVPVEEVYNWYDSLKADKSLISFPQAGHFFHGELIKLMNEIQQHYSK